jgi:phage tail sheath gpL-like
MSDITFNQLSNDLVASKVALELNAQLKAISSAFMSHKVLIIGQYDSAKTVVDYVPFEITGGLQEVKNKYGYGSMLARATDFFIRNAGSSISIFVSPVPEAVAGVKATSSITVTGTATSTGVLYFYIAEKKVPVIVTNTDINTAIATNIAAAVNADLDLPVIATVSSNVVTLTAKWKGLSGNQIKINQNLGGITEINATPSGVTLVLTAMTSGATDPDITNCFATLGGNTWFTEIINPYATAESLTTLEAQSEILSDPLIKRFPNCFTSMTDVVGTAQTLANSRNGRFSTIINVDSSPNFPIDIAAATAGQVAKSAETDPSRPYKTLILTGILPGNKLTYAQLDASEKKGLATTDVTNDNRVKIYDLVTTYKTSGAGASDDAYRYTVTISNLQAKIYSLDAVLSSEPFVRAKIVDDAAITSQEYAISPKVMISFIRDAVDSLWIPQAWSKNRDSIVNSIRCNINSLNASRMDVAISDVLAVGGRIFAVNYGFSFVPLS